MQNRWEREYLNSVERLHFSEKMKERMTETITDRSRSENGGMLLKRFSAKKTVVLAAVCVLVFGATAVFAGSGIVKLFSGAPEEPRWTDYQDLPKAEAETGLDIDAPEDFGNGFVFNGAVISDEKGLDANGETADNWKSINLDYRNDKGALLTLKAQPARTINCDPAEDATEFRETGGIKMFYSQDEFLFVRDRSDATAEELERERSDAHFFVSESGESRETRTYNSVGFVKGEVYYSLYTDEDISADSLFDMAEMILEKK